MPRLDSLFRVHRATAIAIMPSSDLRVPQIQTQHTLCKVVYGEAATRRRRQVLQRNFRLSLSDHEVHNNERLEHDGPCRVAKAVLKGAEDFGDASLTGVRRNKYVLDILGLRCCKLSERKSVTVSSTRSRDVYGGVEGSHRLTLILVAPFTDFSKELAMDCCNCPAEWSKYELREFPSSHDLTASVSIILFKTQDCEPQDNFHYDRVRG